MFRKYVVFKTPLFWLGITLAFAFVVLVFIRIIFYDHFNGLFEASPMNMAPNGTLRNFSFKPAENLGWFCLYVILPLWMLTIGFFKLKEKEV